MRCMAEGNMGKSTHRSYLFSHEDEDNSAFRVIKMIKHMIATQLQKQISLYDKILHLLSTMKHNKETS